MLRSWLSRARVLPVIAPLDTPSTVALCRTLVEAGMTAVEITLRHPDALAALAAVREDQPQLCIAAGTVLDPDQARAAVDAGASFLVSPGLTDPLLAVAPDLGVPLLPGVATASEVMRGLDAGLDSFKLFPATAVGGVSLLKALAGPFPDVVFCPTGGLAPDNFRSFLALPNVPCCGGSWMVSRTLIEGGNWDRIRALAAEAVAEPAMA
ncbi:beta/alpha barrel domain-containing protein [Haliea atlantica]|nr:keto-deoxy-phosphogluconate aldolase [Haliea sp.]|tara:strand:- start:251563 stop:252189 length:627 start_codon:yes stop_codon:yes gene_type:complete